MFYYELLRRLGFNLTIANNFYGALEVTLTYFLTYISHSRDQPERVMKNRWAAMLKHYDNNKSLYGKIVSFPGFGKFNSGRPIDIGYVLKQIGEGWF